MTRTHRLSATLLILALVLGGMTVSWATAPREEVDAIRAMITSGDCEQVLVSASSALEKYPKDPDLLVFDGNCRLALATTVEERFDAERYEQLRLGLGLSQLPRSVSIQLYRQEKSFDDAQVELALARFASARESAPQRADLFVGSVAAHVQAGRLESALALLDGPMPAMELPEIADLARICQDLLNAGQTAQAASLAEKLVARFPESSAPSTAAGAVALSQLKARPAIEHFAKAFELGATQPQARVRLSRLALLARDYESSIGVLTTLASEDLNALAWLAMARTSLLPAAAVPIWNQLDTRLSSIEKPPKNLQRLLTHHKRLMGSEQAPTSAMRLRAAEVFVEDGLDLAAFAEVDAALKLDEKNISAWLFLARRYRGIGFLDLALEALDGAAAATDSAGPLHLQRTEVLIGLQNFEQAFKAADAADKAGSDATYLRGIAALGSGDLKAATKFLRRAATPGNPDEERAKSRLKEIGQSAS